MGIKDKVLDILFDDDNDELDNINHQENHKTVSRKEHIDSIHDTGSIFIDATSPLPVSSPNPRKQNEEYGEESKSDDHPAYQMSENISPIFGPIGKSRKNKNASKIKSINELTNKKLEQSSKAQPYTKVVISPIFGPITTKPVKKNKVRRKEQDPYDRDINDTGSFDTVLSEDDNLEQQFEEANEQAEAVSQKDTLGDTDRLDRISDRINRIKNEAANLYHNGEADAEIISEDGYDVETIEYSSISEVIHDVQNHDEKLEHSSIRVAQNEQQDEDAEVGFAKLEEDSFEEVEQPQPPVIKPAVVEVEKPVESIEPVSETIKEEPKIVFPKPEEFRETPVESVQEAPKEPVQEAPKEPVQEAPKEPVKEPSKELEQFNDFDLKMPGNNIDSINTPNSQLSEDDIFQDEDLDEGKDLFSVLFGDD